MSSVVLEQNQNYIEYFNNFSLWFDFIFCFSETFFPMTAQWDMIQRIKMVWPYFTVDRDTRLDTPENMYQRFSISVS